MDLVHLQKQLINIGKQYVKPSGILIYSTCTIDPEENILLINEFLEENKDFKLVSINDEFQYKEDLHTLDSGYIQLFPNIHNTDGFFIAKMKREV